MVDESEIVSSITFMKDIRLMGTWWLRRGRARRHPCTAPSQKRGSRPETTLLNIVQVRFFLNKEEHQKTVGKP